MRSESTSQPVRPFLATFAVERTGDPSLPGQFDPSRDVWVVDGADGPTPIVQHTWGLGDTSTLTRVKAEADDTDIDGQTMASTTTFTKVTAEGDDTDVSAAAALEIQTKTQAQVEADDIVFRCGDFSPSDWDRPTVVCRLQ